MTPKEYLQQASETERKIELAREKLAKMKSALYGKAVRYDSDGSKHTAPSDNAFEKAIAAVEDYEAKINLEIAALIQTRIEIESVIKSVPDEHQREVLERHYLNCQAFESHYDRRTGEYIKGIDEAMTYEARQIYRFHRRGLNYIRKRVSECQLKV